MRIIEIRTLDGPNVYSHHPVLVMRLCLDELRGKESHEVRGFNERLQAALPGVKTHCCSLGRPGGFSERLSEGTYFGHIVEHVALELTELAGVPAFHGKTRATKEPGCYQIAIEYKAEQGTKYLLQTAVELVESLIQDQPFPLEQRLKEAEKIIARTELGPSTKAIVAAARRRGIPWRRLNQGSLVQFGYGKHRKLIQAAMTGQTSAIAVEIASDKELTKTLLRDAGIPVPRGLIAATAEEAVAAMIEIGAPVAIKP